MNRKLTENLIVSCVLLTISSVSSVSLAQQKPLAAELSRYSAMLEGYAKNPQVIRTLPDSALKADARIMFEADDRDAGWVGDYGVRSVRKHDSLYALYRRGVLTSRPSEIPTRMKPPLIQRLASILTENQIQLISTPCFAVVKVDSIWAVKDTVRNPPLFTLVETDLIVTVENVIKGHGMLSPGQSVRIYYMNIWHVTSMTIGGSYFLFLSPISQLGTAGSTRIQVLSNVPAYWGDKARYRGVYPVVNGMLIDPNDDWGYGKQVSWIVFQNDVGREIANIKSW